MNTMLRRWSLAIAVGFVSMPAAAWAAQADSPAIDPQGIERLQAATGGRTEVSFRRGTGAAQFVRLGAGTGEASLAPQAARGASATQQAKAFFVQYGTIFGIQNAESNLVATDERVDRLGFKHATFQQLHRGVPVFGAQLKGHVNAEGRLVAVNGTGVPGITLDTTPRRSSAEAGQFALAAVVEGLSAVEDGKEAPSAEGVAVRNTRLVVYRTGLLQGVAGDDHLAYEVEVGNGAGIREFVFVDAHTGKKVDQITGIQDALDRRAYDGQNLPNVPPSYPDSPFWVEGDPLPTTSVEADNMIYASGETHSAFMSAFGYDSFDGLGATMDAIFNRGYSCPNASWNGTFISFCPGFTTDDVTAHEWGHAYTTYTDGLIYAWQSGALNEAYSDIFGETIDFINNRGLDAPGGPRTEGQCSDFTPPVGQLVINTPASIARTSPAQSAGFGPPLSSTGVTGSVVVGLDTADSSGSGPLTTDGCSAFTNAAAVNGNIALVDRGTCNFSAKVYNAQLAGAVAVIVNNNAASGLPGMAAGVNAGLVTIPSLGILKVDGDAIKAALATSPVNSTLRTSGGATDNSYRWLMGEEVTPGGALRDMFSPNCVSNPAKVTDLAFYVCGPVTNDQGGVHTNSGVPNKMFALLVDGGLFNNQNVQAIGLTKAVHVYFRAKFYQVASSDFPEHADSMEQACSDLRGQPLASLTGTGGSAFITATDCAQVTKAIAAVELRTPPTQCNFQPQLAKNPPANVCVVGPANLVFTDNLEGSTAAWTRSNQGVFPSYTPRNWVQTASLPADRAGAGFFALDDPNLGDCAANDESGAMYVDSPAITLPATPGFGRLVFDHYVATEGGWDGGNVKVSVNGGPFQTTVFTQFAYNPYKFALFSAAQGNTNPLAGQQAFTGADDGSNRGSWGTSILDLAGMGQPGDSVRVRFAFGVDGCAGNDGWYLDDIKMYQCTAGGAATVSINDVTVTEGDSGTKNATFTLTLSEPSSTTVTVRANTANDTAVGGNDYVVISNRLVTFAAGVTTQTVNVVVNGDTTDENDETYFLNLSSPVNVTIADGQGLGTILDEVTDLGTPPTPNMTVNNASTTEGNSGTKNLNFTVSISPTSATPVTVQVDTADDTATAGSDYTAIVGQTVTFPPGAATQTVSVSLLGDTAIEANETFFVNLSNATNANITDPQGLGTINNDDVASLSIDNVTQAEGQSGNTTATFTVTLSQAALAPVTVTVNTANATAVAPGDYTAVSALVLTFAPNETTKTVDVTVVDDTLIEGDETFNVNLTLPTNATISDSQGVGTITDTDTAGGFFTVAPCRAIDTRNANGPVLAGQSSRVFTLTGQCGIPATATSVVANLTAVGATTGGFFRAYAAAPAPNTTVLNFNAGQSRGNNAVLGLNAAGEVTIFNDASGTVHLVLDVAGYFE